MNCLRKIFFTILILLFYLSTFANIIDSLVVKLNRAQSKEVKHELIKSIVNEYFNKEKDEKTEQFDAFEEFSEPNINDSSDLAFFYETKGSFFLSHHKAKDAFENISKSISIYKSLKCEIGIARTNLLLSKILVDIYDFKKGLHILKEAQIYAHDKEKWEIEIEAFDNMSIIYIELGQYDKADSVLKQSNYICSLHNDTTLSCKTLSCIAKLEHAKGNFDAESVILLRAIALIRFSRHYNTLADLYFDIATAYESQDYFLKSQNYLNKSLHLYKNKCNCKYKEARTLNQLGNNYLVVGNIDFARKYINEALILAEYNNYDNLLRDIYLNLSKIYEHEYNYANALNYYKKYEQIKDSLYSETQLQNVENIRLEIKNSKQDELIHVLKKRESAKNVATIASILAAIFFFIILINLYIQSVNKNRINKELKRQKNKAEEADRLKSAFLANMSHEIRAPMNAIIGFSDIVSESDKLDNELITYMGYIQQSGRNLINLVDDIIDISKIEAGQLKIRKSSFNVDNMLKGLYTSVKASNETLKNFNVNLILQIPDNKDNISLSIVNDELRIKQVITNFISNAIKFTEKGKIEFGYEKLPDNQLLFYTKDTGVGISEKDKNLIFRRFGQIEDTYVRNKSGTGLGLAISESIVKLLDGEIWFDSIEGKGSTFFFKIPVVFDNSNIKLKTNIKNEVLNINWKDKLFLVVEDDDINYKVAQSLLKKTGVKLIRVDNGKDAVETALSNNEIDLILMDVQLPVMHGYNATREIRKHSDIPIIAVTAYAMPEEEQKSIDAGCNAFITKPYNIKDIISKISEFVV